MENIEILTRSAKETKKLGEKLAHEIDRSPTSIKRGAIIISLEGELGSGKTTFTQGFAKGLGIKENPRSPTFVIMRIYSVRRKAYGVRQFIHIDAYRLKSKGFKVLNWRDFIRDPKNIILVEWGDKIKNILPKNAMRIIFKHIRHHEHRLIKIII
ncbi:tRNA (adenosine(37)-N6)-threonylcarbamoyltransferase complex ATPase subunit type 1 TsaE [Candidatus Giovannonibacteria bacterium RIFCSPLOWO2_12_FULL_44_25]|uniref:tRNA threonylcarbamoyladenosine biosynthesis protein TsaE n=3 Tax=Candidatus Giovannoniibacteriota TaxID=1752738 RepID=A0A0G1IBS7_9BACT|nr:MAG: ATPase YjeE, predicted to have essential role in cell wall biosynthesis [Parcubacteria group bacterium GW2011_GWC1_44_10]KKT56871.1 MAG: ATPase YjeE, predicted to have essential role in cell wall biosynthesis [Candidatus Giovannonibacteria bacterium GW2011_GWB1_44_23]KKT59440.1 MAG: ATPase YjeE, predicted to have essential role in cell wall biosynthesis [Candidatus Giovannonibacteria bacterium GW2011_GWA1_44_25]OGF49588.1 MAG: tRNA (adenosine(37)-N6)-threonylcarbamoyltransferase complex 